MTSDGLTTDQQLASLQSQITDLWVAVRELQSAVTAGSGIPSRLVFSSPVDPMAFGSWGVGWWDASPFATDYLNTGVLHTGADLNAPNDVGANVYAVADGIVRFTGNITGWQGDVIVIEHNDGGALVWTRYAHIVRSLAVTLGMSVKRGDVIGVIADYTPKGPKGDHLHYDVAKVNLDIWPGDWPGSNLALVKQHYHDPLEWHKAHRP